MHIGQVHFLFQDKLLRVTWQSAFLFLVTSFGLASCVFVKPYEAKDSPDYPFSLRFD